MLINPPQPVFNPRPADRSAIARMFADWCVRQGAEVEIEDVYDTRYVTAERGDRRITAAFDGFDGRFLRDGAVFTECEFGSATTLKELARALRTGHRKGGHRR